MIKYLRNYPTTLDIELLYLLSNLWWLIVFTSPVGYFSGLLYDRALIFVNKNVIISVLAILVFIGIVALSRREQVTLALITGPMSYLYLATMSILGTEIALNAGILFIIPVIGIYRLFSYTLYKNETGATATPDNI